MAANMEDDVQLIMESSWTVCRGSLESCITVVFVDPVSQEPVVPSNCNTERLSLVPAEESVPCEITVKFQGRKCDVQSLYILSTARTYELYSKADLVMDPEYVCTVRGWIPDKGNEAGSSGESMKITPANCSANLAPEVIGDENILDETEHASADLSCKVKEQLIGSASQIINDQTVVHDSVGVNKEALERSIYSSGEDSWVDVKFSGSFSGESLSEGSISQSLNGQLDGTHQGRDWLDRHSLENNSRSILVADSMQTVCAELNSGSLLTKDCCVPIPRDEENAESRDFSRPLVVQENMYEAELELVDQCPWTSLTIRFLSLKGRSCVEVDQIVLLVVPGPPVLKAASSNQSLCGGDSSALLAMLIPSMLRMVQGVPNQRPKDASHGLQLNSTTSSNTFRSTVDLSTSEKHDKESSRTLCMSADVNSIANAEATMKGRQDLSTPVENMNDDNVTKHNTACSTSRTESTLSSAETSEKPLQPSITVLSEREARMMNSDKPLENSLQPVSKVQLACKAGYACSHSCEHGKGSHANLLLNLDPFLERFDRLEAVCMRMEAYIVQAVDKLDQRLTNLEREHTTLPMCMPLEPGHVASKESCSFSSTPSLSVSPLPSDAGCLGAKVMDAAESSAWIGTTIYEKADTQETAFKAQILDSSDVNTSTGGSLGAVDEVSKIFQVEVPASTAALESRSSAMLDVQGYPEEKPQISLDDAWNSALSAFSSSCIPANIEVLSPFVDMDSEVQHDISQAMEDSQSCCSQSDVITSVPCVGSEGALSLDDQAFSDKSPVTSSFGIEKPKDTPQSEFHNHAGDMSFDQVSHREGEQTIPLCKDWNLEKTETYLSDLQGHDVEVTLSMDAQDFSDESSVTSAFGIDKPKDSPQSGFHNHTVGMSFDQVSHKEGEQTVPLCNDWNLEKRETFVIDLQGHDACDYPFGSVLQFTVNDNCPQSGFHNHTGDTSFDQVSHREGKQTIPLCKDWNFEKAETFLIDLQGHDVEGTLSMDAQDVSDQSSVTSSFGIDKPKDSPQSGFHNHTGDMSFDQVSHREGEQTIALCKDWNLEKAETFLIDLQGHDVEGTLSMDAQDFSDESSVTSAFGIDKLKDNPQSGFHNHTDGMSFDQASHKEGEQTVSLCKDWRLGKTETFVIDLQGHVASDDPFRSVLQFTVNDNCPLPCSRGEVQKILNNDAVFDLVNCLCSINSEQETILSEIDTLASDMGKSHFNPVDLGLLNIFSSVPNELINIECKEDGSPSSEIALANILGEVNVNDPYDSACSESSTCISQEFDTFHDPVSDCEWFSHQNLFLMQDIAMTDNDISKQGLDLEENLFMNSNYSNSSSRHLKGAPILHSFFDFSLSEPHLLDLD